MFDNTYSILCNIYSLLDELVNETSSTDKNKDKSAKLSNSEIRNSERSVSSIAAGTVINFNFSDTKNLTSAAVGLSAIESVLKSMGKNQKTINDGIKVLTNLSTALVTFGKSNALKTITEFTKTLIISVGGMALLVVLMGTIKWATIFEGILKMALVATLFAFTVFTISLASKIGSKALTFSAIEMTLSIAAFVVPLMILAFLPWPLFWEGFLKLGLTSTLFVGICALAALTSKIGKMELELSGLYMVAGITAFIVPLLILSLIPWNKFWKGFGMLFITSVLFLGVAILTKVVFKTAKDEALLAGLYLSVSILALLIPILAFAYLPFGKLLQGVGMTIAIYLAFVVLFSVSTKIINKMATTIKKNTMDGMIKISIAISLLVIPILLLTWVFGNNWGKFLNAIAMLGIIMAIYVGFFALVLFINKMNRGVGKNSLMKNVIVITAAFMAICLSMLIITKATERLAALDQGKMWSAFGFMIAMVAAISALMIGIGLLSNIPGLKLAMAIGGVVLIAVAGIISLFGNAMLNLAQAMETASKLDTATVTTTLANVAGLIMSVFKAISKLSITEVSKSAHILNKVSGSIGVIGEFAKIISDYFDSDGNIKTVIGYDNNGKPKFGKGVNMELAGIQIGTAMTSFISTLNDTLTTTLDKSRIKEIGTNLALISNTVEPIQSFIKIIAALQKAGINADGFTEMTLMGYDKNGIPKYKIGPGRVNLIKIAEQISSAISTFASTLANSLNSKNIPELTDKKSISVLFGTFTDISKLIETISKKDVISEFNKNIKDFPGIVNILNKLILGNDSSSLNVKELTDAKNEISSASKSISTNVESLVKSFDKLNDSITKNLIKKTKDIDKFTESISKLATELKKVGDATNSIKEDVKINISTSNKENVDVVQNSPIRGNLESTKTKPIDFVALKNTIAEGIAEGFAQNYKTSISFDAFNEGTNEADGVLTIKLT